MPKYNQQIIIAMSPIGEPGIIVKNLIDKWNKNNNPANCHVLYIEQDFSKPIQQINDMAIRPCYVNVEYWKRVFSQMDTRTRIYIHSHCMDGSNILISDEQYGSCSVISYTELAYLLFYMIPSGLHPCLVLSKISLLGCEAGGKVSQPAIQPNPQMPVNNSFAAKLSYELKNKYAIEIDIVARTGLVTLIEYQLLSAGQRISTKPVTDQSENVETNSILNQFHCQLFRDNIITAEEFERLHTSLNQQLAKKCREYHAPFSKVKYFYDMFGIQQCIDAYAKCDDIDEVMNFNLDELPDLLI